MGVSENTQKGTLLQVTGKTSPRLNIALVLLNNVFKPATKVAIVTKEFRHNTKKAQEYRNIKISNMVKITSGIKPEVTKQEKKQKL